MKSGNIDPTAMMAQNRSIGQGPGKSLMGHNPSVQSHQNTSQNSNEKAVREMLISLLR